jgi:hypothetical protein
MQALFALSILAMDLSSLSLAIETPRNTVLIGEPVKLAIRWRATRAIADVAVEDRDFMFQSLRLAVEQGEDTTLYKESPHQLGELVLVRRRFEPGQERVTEHVFYHGAYMDGAGRAQESFLFPAPGTYWLSVLYVHGGKVTNARSNRIRFEVKAPTGSDREVLEAIRRQRLLLTGQGGLLHEATKLLNDYPSSPYLRMSRLMRFRYRQSLLGAESDPDSRESFFHLGEAGRAAFKKRYYARMVEEILGEPDWSPFGDEALGLAALYAAGAGDRVLAERLRTELVDRYPRSRLGERLKKEMVR